MGRREEKKPPRAKSAPAADSSAPAGDPPKWMWATPDIKEEHRGLIANGTARLDEVILRLLAGEERRKDVKSLGDGILEVRAREGNNHYRALYFRWGQHFVCLMSRYKNQQKTPQQWIDVAKERRGAFRERFGMKPPPSA